MQDIGEISLIIINKRDVRHTESSNIDENTMAGVTASRQKFTGALSPIYNYQGSSLCMYVI
jgi:hypothetical protein